MYFEPLPNRHVRGEDAPVSELWGEEKSIFFAITRCRLCSLHHASGEAKCVHQVELDTNRYSVPVEYRNSLLVLHQPPKYNNLFTETLVNSTRCTKIK